VKNEKYIVKKLINSILRSSHYLFEKELFTLRKLFTSIAIFTIHYSLFTIHCLAQQQYTITNYTQEQGLPSGTISGIYKDTTGYLWLTSEEGIARFNGYNFKVFRHNPDDSTSLPTDVAWYGAFPRYGDIYFETPGRFCKYNPATESFTYNLPFGDSLDLFRINEAKGISNHYWALSKFSVFKISKTGTQHFALPYPIAPKDWRVIPSADKGVLLTTNSIGTPHLLFLDEKSKAITEVKILDREGKEDSSTYSDVFFSGNDFYFFNKKSVFRFNSVKRAFEWIFDLKHKGNFDYAFQFYLPFNDSLVIIRSQTGFLNIINIRTGEEQLVYVNKRIPEKALTDRMILNCTADNNGGVWMGTAQMGIIHYNLSTGELTQYIHEPGNPNRLPGNMIDRILVDENGVIWASCFGLGLIKMEPITALFKTAVPATAKNSNTEGQGWSANIRGFLETDDGYWIATMNGLFSYSGQTQQFSNIQSLCPANIETRSGNYDRLLNQGFPVGSLARDHAGNIWIGTWYSELVIYNTRLKRSYSIRPKPLKDANENIFRSLFCDSKNRMWIATWASGICMVDCNALNFEKINEIKFEYNFPDAKDSSALPPGVSFVISEDVNGNIWAGTENGLCRYNEQTKKWKRYVNIPGNEKSLHNSNVRSLCLDKKGTLWIGTNGGGLNQYSKEQDNFTHFTKANGLPDDKIYTLLCDNNGMLWMGTICVNLE
jgi:ligand-binding sensor domain-containing protein